MIKLLAIALDCAAVAFSFCLATFITLHDPGWRAYLITHTNAILLSVFIAPVIFYASDIYPNYKQFSSFIGLMLLWKAIAFIILAQGIIVYLYPLEILGRSIFALAVALEVFLLTVSKAAFSVILKQLAPKDRAIIVGYNPWKEFYFEFLRDTKKEDLPFEIVGIVSDECEGEFMRQLPFGVLGPSDVIESIVQKYRASTLILTSTYTEKEGLQEFLIMAHHNHVRLMSLETLYEEATRKVPYQNVNKTELLNECLLANKFAQLKKKRVVDIILSSYLALILLPLGCLVAILVRLTSEGPVFYRQERLGFRGRPFKLVKFRTMRVDAEKGGEAMLTLENDPRVTAFGRFLRLTHLDEIPQLLNVLWGDMSLVGPRPERQEFIKKLETRIPLYALRLFAKPGITGWAQIHSGYAATVAELEEKFRFDLYYLKHISLALDFKIILMTTTHLLFAKGR